MHVLQCLRRNRRLGGGLLLLVWLTLLPLRGFAEIGMHLGGTAATPVAMAVAMPCHGGMAGPVAEAATAFTGAAADDAASTCVLCALCHAPALPVAELRLAWAEPAAPATRAGARAHAPPALPLPERPPRS
jgi:hypothetical protein